MEVQSKLRKSCITNFRYTSFLCWVKNWVIFTQMWKTNEKKKWVKIVKQISWLQTRPGTNGLITQSQTMIISTRQVLDIMPIQICNKSMLVWDGQLKILVISLSLIKGKWRSVTKKLRHLNHFSRPIISPKMLNNLMKKGCYSIQVQAHQFNTQACKVMASLNISIREVLAKKMAFVDKSIQSLWKLQRRRK